MANVGSNPTPSANQKSEAWLASHPILGTELNFMSLEDLAKKSGVKYTILTKS